MSQVDNSNSNYINLDQNQITKINYPDLSNYVPPQSYNTTIQVSQNSLDELKMKRMKLLFNCYKYQAMSFFIVLVIQIIGLTKWFMSIQTKFSKIKLAGYYYSYEEYLKYHSDAQTYKEYEDWRQKEYYEISQVRWTFYVIIALLILNTLAILIGRIHRNIVKYQQSLFYSQAVLIGLCLVGYAGKYWDSYWIHKNICEVTITINSILLLNSLVNLSLIKIDKLHYYNKLANNVIYLQVPFNFILILLFKKFDSVILIFESIAAYGLFYFNELNRSLLLNPEELPPQKDITTMFNEAVQTDNQSQEIMKNNPDFISIPRRKLVLVAAILSLIALIIIQIMSRESYLCLPLILLAGLILNLLFETRVASRSLQHDDNFIAASMVYLDLLCPIQNLVRCFGIVL
ncbi:unnamed protein product (macronuclear) [Paramecium tetraurelia]|uniref:Transmembrane protein n=1 Tax=Paramecium tetraurelia TaxID=5888 RepID=A0C184_PARTE|nr:uncharacterized protein GSPATT00034027001 [Paramecium tetraurelia]CAK64551.1 unnamed protein product [Paramecium tetraurelia]|eukprot:XP_001431949.1 hypothetical protein (macronuclear) [Paramecium tetraurelia strain d4-2]